MPSAGLVAEERRILETLGPEVPAYDWEQEGTSQEGYFAWLDSPEGQARAAWQEGAGALEMGGIADLIAFVHLLRWPVVEPDRMRAAREHILSMVTLSRENSRRILAGTDDNREWVPGSQQTVHFPSRTRKWCSTAGA
jgi:hypothetical protein